MDSHPLVFIVPMIFSVEFLGLQLGRFRRGIIAQNELSDRVYNCPMCGLSTDRDLNVAINVLRLGLQPVGIGRHRSPGR